MNEPSLAASAWSPSSRWGLLGVLWLVSAVAGFATDPPPRPVDGIWDDARLLPDALHAELAADIRSVRAQTGCEVWLAAVTFVAGDQNIQGLARDLREAWTAGGPSIIIAFDRATSKHSIAPSASFWQRYPTPMVIEALRASARPVEQSKAPVEERVAAAVRELVSRIQTMEGARTRQHRLLTGREGVLAVLFLGLLTLGGLVAALGLKVWRAKRHEATRTYLLPEVQVGMRLGAPYGGGVVVEMRVNERAADEPPPSTAVQAAPSPASVGSGPAPSSASIASTRSMNL